MSRINRITTFAAMALVTLAATSASAQQVSGPYGTLNSSAFVASSTPLKLPSLAVSPEVPFAHYDARDVPPDAQDSVDSGPQILPTKQKLEETLTTVSAPDVSAATVSIPTTIVAEPSTVAPPIVAPQELTDAMAPIDPMTNGRLIAKARQAIQLGQIAQGRALLEIAASLHISDAMFMLAQTYDPDVLSRWNVVGLSGDADIAARYYREAAKGRPLHEPQRVKPQYSNQSILPRIASQFDR